MPKLTNLDILREELAKDREMFLGVIREILDVSKVHAEVAREQAAVAKAYMTMIFPVGIPEVHHMTDEDEAKIIEERNAQENSL